mmetsp:Transcript_25598/g.71532  ORF Transcript_25598/g.71532 Transcript_25598/m.71532 type:complete len:278 (+) Transcript_25598:642-1475(+)
MRRACVTGLVLLALVQDEVVVASGIACGTLDVKDHDLVGVVLVHADALGTVRRGVILDQDLLSHVLGRQRRSIRHEMRHGELHLDVEAVAAQWDQTLLLLLRHGEGVALAGVAVVVGIEADDLEPLALHGGVVKVAHGGCGGSRLLARPIGAARQDGDLDAFVVLDGAFEEVVEVVVAVARHASRDARVVAQALGGAREALAAGRVVGKARLGLQRAPVHETRLVHQRGIEALASVNVRQLVLRKSRRGKCERRRHHGRCRKAQQSAPEGLHASTER